MAAPNSVSFESTLHTEQATLVFPDFVTPDVIACSSVLSNIAEGGGGAKLPDSITPSEFRTWASSVEAANDPSHLPSLRNLCIVAKVTLAYLNRTFAAWESSIQLL